MKEALKKNLVLTIRISEEQYAKALVVAERKQCSFSQLVRSLLNEAIMDSENKMHTPDKHLYEGVNLKHRDGYSVASDELVLSLFENEKFRTMLKKFIDSSVL